MTVEQLAEKWVDEWGICCRAENMNANQFAKQAYIAGYNEAQNTITQCNRSALSGVKWHKVADGDLPPEDTKVLALMAGGEVCIAHFYNRNVWDKIGTVIAWKEIELPKEIKENDIDSQKQNTRS